MRPLPPPPRPLGPWTRTMASTMSATSWTRSYLAPHLHRCWPPPRVCKAPRGLTRPPSPRHAPPPPRVIQRRLEQNGGGGEDSGTGCAWADLLFPLPVAQLGGAVNSTLSPKMGMQGEIREPLLKALWVMRRTHRTLFLMKSLLVINFGETWIVNTYRYFLCVIALLSSASSGLPNRSFYSFLLPPSHTSFLCLAFTLITTIPNPSTDIQNPRSFPPPDGRSHGSFPDDGAAPRGSTRGCARRQAVSRCVGAHVCRGAP
jgi:hypothetical protein